MLRARYRMGWDGGEGVVMVIIIGVVEELWFHRPSSGSLKLARVIARYLPR